MLQQIYGIQVELYQLFCFFWQYHSEFQQDLSDLLTYTSVCDSKFSVKYIKHLVLGQNMWTQELYKLNYQLNHQSSKPLNSEEFTDLRQFSCLIFNKYKDRYHFEDLDIVLTEPNHAVFGYKLIATKNKVMSLNLPSVMTWISPQTRVKFNQLGLFNVEPTWFVCQCDN